MPEPQDPPPEDFESIAQRLRRDPAGLFPAVAQDSTSGDVLMVAWMNDEALRLTLTTGRATYFSRSRQSLWTKGETSGHVQYVREVRLDCDADTVLVKVDQVGPACHTGTRTCFDADLLDPLVLSTDDRIGTRDSDKGDRDTGDRDTGDSE